VLAARYKRAMPSGTVDEVKGRGRRASRRRDADGEGARPSTERERSRGQETAIFGRVHVLRDVGTDFLCLLGARQVWVPLTEIRYGTELAKAGDYGRLVISTWFAQALGLR
jgi:hypothetical protein